MMRITQMAAAMLIAAGILIASNAAYAYGDGTPDGAPPAEEQVCEDAGLFGSAYGLCVAFCEANDCDAQVEDDRSCSRLRDKYFRTTGEPFFPCESGPEEE